MKILILTNSGPGLYRFRKELIQELLIENDTVYLSLPCEEEAEELAAMGCVLIDTPVDRRGTNIWKDLRLIRSYDRILDRLNPDLVLTYTIKPNIYGGILCGIKKLKYMANITGLGTSIENKGVLSKLAMLLYKAGLRRAETVFFQNQENQHFFQDRKIVRGNTILIPGSGVNLEEHPYEIYPKDQEEILFLFVGRIMRDKGIEEFLLCAEMIKADYKNVRFDIIGEFDEKKYERPIRDLEERQIITYLGKQKNVHSFMKSHHALIQPSYHEGISNVLLEAAACGRPVIASLVSGCMETFDDGVTGIGFEARNAYALAAAVRRFLTLTHEQMEQMGKMGRRKIQTEFDRKFVVGAYMQEIKRREAFMSHYENIVSKKEKIALIGLGYVGMPIAVSFSQKADVIGFDINETKVRCYRNGIDPTHEVGDDEIRRCRVEFTSDERRLKEAGFYIVAVPTPVKTDHTPDLSLIEGASRVVGRNLARGSVVVYESTVYPGVTEEVCVPILERESGLTCGTDFKIGYSPERINPGDRTHRLDTVIKVVSGMDEETLEEIASVYSLVAKAGVYRAESIRVAEAAKVIENSQRDINIAFMNELAIIFNKMNIDTKSVLKAAGTKWNFMNFYPGLVGGHCIGIDPYYLTYKAEMMGYHSQVILAGRRINDNMGKYVAECTIKKMIFADIPIKCARVAVLGFTFKENCPDTRNSRVIDIVDELKEYGIEPVISDPVADAKEAEAFYQIQLFRFEELHDCDAVILAVAHNEFAGLGARELDPVFRYTEKRKKVLVDVKGLLDKKDLEEKNYTYWRL